MGEVVGNERMGTAMSIDIAANNGSRMLGPTIGGVMLAGAGIAGVFALGVALYATRSSRCWGLVSQQRGDAGAAFGAGAELPRDCGWRGRTSGCSPRWW